MTEQLASAWPATRLLETMHAPRRLPFEPDEPEWPRASTSTPRISLIRVVALSVPAVAVAALALAYLTLGVDFIDIWRERPVVRLGAVGLAAWLAGGIGWLFVEAAGLWARRDVTEGTRG
jgi:hypothetical protein